MALSQTQSERFSQTASLRKWKIPKKVPFGEGTLGKYFIFINFENQVQGCARQQRSVEKWFLQKCFSCRGKHGKFILLGGGLETSVIGVQNSYMPVHTNDIKYKYVPLGETIQTKLLPSFCSKM
jgi:hypothetical protein